jgi:tetratricopeptide (TPR) repeat protein
VFALRFGLVWLVVLLCLSLSGTARADRAKWHNIDTEELARVRQESFEAGELFDTAEAKLLTGDLQGAEKALAEARAAVPNSWLLGRRHCQVLTELGRRAEAREACKMALVKSSAMDSRAMVGALMASPDLATPGELIQAVREAVAARRLHEQPFSDAALCDIAHHVGDEAMLNLCVDGLRRVAPQNFETLRWQAVQKRSPAWALWLAWAALAFAVLGTGLHALVRWLRRPAKTSRPAVAATVIGLLLAGHAGPARAEAPAPATSVEMERVPAGQPLPPDAKPENYHWQLSRFPIKHDDPESLIPSIEERNQDPLEFGYFLQDLNTEALKAERAGDYQKSVKYWRAAAKAVPDEAVAFGKACRAYQKLGQREQAIEQCSQALNRNGATEEDYLRYGELVTQNPLPLTQLEIQDLDAVVTHLREQNEEGPAAVVECRVGVKLEDKVRLQRCTQVLAKLSPTDPRSMTFMWSYALLRKDYGEAKRLVVAMEKASMPAAALAEVKAATAKASAWWRRPFTDWRYGVAAALGLCLLAGGLLLLRRKLARFEPDNATGPATAT